MEKQTKIRTDCSTVMNNVTWEDAIMKEEIFGPIMPILTFENLSELYALLANKPKAISIVSFHKIPGHILRK